MSFQGTGRFALLLMPAIAAAHSSLYYKALPERLASHFDLAGAANDWMGKGEFVAFYIGIVAFLVLVFAGVGFLIRALPPEHMNMPNREYWLAPERRAATARGIGDDLAWFGVLNCILIITLMDFTFRANLTANPQLGATPMLIVVGFLVAESALLIQMVLRFSKVPSGASASER